MSASTAFWRDLKAQFEDLENPRDRRTVALFLERSDGEGWSLATGGSFYSRFRTFAMRGGAAARGLDGEKAIEGWLELLRLRVPHYWHSVWSFEYQREVEFLRIDPPTVDDQALHRSVETMTLQPQGDRFAVLSGHYLYAVYREDNARTIQCTIRHGRFGQIHELREASVELCELLESEALAADAIAAQSFTRKSVIEPLLQARGWSTGDWAQEAKVDFNTADNYLNNRTTKVRPDTLKKLADALKIDPSAMPT